MKDMVHQRDGIIIIIFNDNCNMPIVEEEDNETYDSKGGDEEEEEE